MNEFLDFYYCRTASIFVRERKEKSQVGRKNIFVKRTTRIVAILLMS